VSSCRYTCVLMLLYVSSYCYICVLMPLYMCPHAAIYVSSYCYICVLMLLSRETTRSGGVQEKKNASRSSCLFSRGIRMRIPIVSHTGSAILFACEYRYSIRGIRMRIVSQNRYAIRGIRMHQYRRRQLIYIFLFVCICMLLYWQLYIYTAALLLLQCGIPMRQYYPRVLIQR
jgi:hypothetical protein